MNPPVIICSILLLTISLGSGDELHPFSDEFIDSINNNQSSWTAGRNFPEDTPLAHFRSLSGVLTRTDGLTTLLPLKRDRPHSRLLGNIPETFDSRIAWPECASIIGDIGDQSSCGACWAFAATEAISDRICIHSRGAKKVKISAQDLLTCCHNCGEGCNGGYASDAWLHWIDVGIVSGGAYGSNEGCKAYTFAPCDRLIGGPACIEAKETPRCIKSCDQNSTLSYSEDLYKGEDAYGISQSEEDIRLEIMTNGPVEASFLVYEDFYSYKSGVYRYVKGKFTGGHGVKILGWGVENGEKYWLAANSWGEDWGDRGYFKILRGSNECQIEDLVLGGIPKMN